MHLAWGTQVAEVAFLPSHLSTTEAYEGTFLVVGEVRVKLHRRWHKYCGRRRPLARSLLGWLLRHIKAGSVQFGSLVQFAEIGTMAVWSRKGGGDV
jgi:hypothetical protein